MQKAVILPITKECECVNPQCVETVTISPRALQREHNKGRLVYASSCQSLEDPPKMRSYGWERIDHRGRYGRFTTIGALGIIDDDDIYPSTSRD